jgi:hypothetical protein
MVDKYNRAADKKGVVTNINEKGVGVLFFRLVNTRYKEKEYVYLKLLESRREGNKIKHTQLVDLSNIEQLRDAYRVRSLTNDLNRTLFLYREISESGPAWCKYLKTSYLLALENAFNVKHLCRDRDFREVLLLDGKRKYGDIFNENDFYSLIYQKASEGGMSNSLICWIENITSGTEDEDEILTCFLLDSSGFPLKFIILPGQQGGEVSGLPNFRVEDRKPEFFLAPACERLYNTFLLMELAEKEKDYVFKEIFLCKQSADCSGKPDFTMEKLMVCGSKASLKDEKINGAVLAVTNLKNHIDYINQRIGRVAASQPLTAQDLVCTYFISSFFKKMFDDIILKHNIRN